MFHKLNSAAALPDLRLLLHFADGSARVYDMAPLLDRMEFFRPLQTVPGLFAQVQVDPGGYGVSWNDDIDLDGESSGPTASPWRPPSTGSSPPPTPLPSGTSMRAPSGKPSATASSRAAWMP